MHKVTVVTEKPAKEMEKVTRDQEKSERKPAVGMTHRKMQQKLHTRLSTFIMTRGLHKAIVRNIPSFLSKNEFFLGLNVSLPINQWYFCQGGSQAPSSVALSALTHNSSLSSNAYLYSSLAVRAYAMLGGSPEYSVAYFGFDDEATLAQFISKYNNFTIEVDNKQKHVL